jgi:hypothetical protein
MLQLLRCHVLQRADQLASGGQGLRSGSAFQPHQRRVEPNLDLAHPADAYQAIMV